MERVHFTKSLVCEACKLPISPELLKILKKGQNNVYCVHCGNKIGPSLVESTLEERNLESFSSHIESQINIEQGTQVIFSQNCYKRVMLFLCRRSLQMFNDRTILLDIRREENYELHPAVLRKVANHYRTLLIKAILPPSLLKGLASMNQDRVRTCFKNLQHRIKNKKLYHVEYESFLQEVVNFTYRLYIGNQELSDLKGFELEIAKDLMGEFGFHYLENDTNANIIVMTNLFVEELYGTLIHPDCVLSLEQLKEETPLIILKQLANPLYQLVFHETIKEEWKQKLEAQDLYRFKAYYKQVSGNIHRNALYKHTFVEHLYWIIRTVIRWMTCGHDIRLKCSKGKGKEEFDVRHEYIKNYISVQPLFVKDPRFSEDFKTCFTKLLSRLIFISYRQLKMGNMPPVNIVAYIESLLLNTLIMKVDQEGYFLKLGYDIEITTFLREFELFQEVFLQNLFFYFHFMTIIKDLTRFIINLLQKKGKRLLAAERPLYKDFQQLETKIDLLSMDLRNPFRRNSQETQNVEDCEKIKKIRTERYVNFKGVEMNRRIIYYKKYSRETGMDAIKGDKPSETFLQWFNNNFSYTEFNDLSLARQKEICKAYKKYKPRGRATIKGKPTKPFLKWYRNKFVKLSGNYQEKEKMNIMQENNQTKSKEIFEEESKINKNLSVNLTKNKVDVKILTEYIYDLILIKNRLVTNKGRLFNIILGNREKLENSIKEIIKSLKIKPNKTNKTQVRNSLIILAHLMLKSKNYKELLKDVQAYKKVSSQIAVKHIKKNIYILKKSKKEIDINLDNWLPKSRSKYNDDDINHWVELLTKYGNIKTVLKHLKKEKKYNAPMPQTLSTKIINKIGIEEYKRLLKRNVDWAQGRKYKEIVNLAKKVGIEKTGKEGEFITSKEDFENTSYPDYAEFLWRCGLCHKTFKKTLGNVSRGSWCEECLRKINRKEMIIPIEEIRKAANDIGIEKTGYPGKFLATEKEYYKKKKTAPSRTPYWCECGRCQHRWKAMPDKIVNKKTWCPYCSQGYSEKIVRGFFERIFKEKFRNTSISKVLKDLNLKLEEIYPHFSVFEQSMVKNLILNGHFDGWNRKFNLAFEYNGKQHKKFIPDKFHKTYDDFLYQKKLDDIKKRLSNILKINLIVIDYNIEYKDMQNFIIEKYEELTGNNLPKMKIYDYRKFLIPINKKEIYSVKDNWSNVEKKYLEIYKNKKIAVLDIETTGGNKTDDKIIEIGIVELDINTGNIEILFNSLIKESGFTAKKYMDNYGIKKCGISPFRIEKLKNKSTEDFREILQLIFKNYKVATWSTSDFDFLWMESRNFYFPRKIYNIQKYARKIIKKVDKDAPYSLQGAWNFFKSHRKNQEDRVGKYLMEKDYKVSHRAIDDAWHEAKILYFLMLGFKFPIDKLQMDNFFKPLNSFKNIS